MLQDLIKATTNVNGTYPENVIASVDMCDMEVPACSHSSICSIGMIEAFYQMSNSPEKREQISRYFQKNTDIRLCDVHITLQVPCASYNL